MAIPIQVARLAASVLVAAACGAHASPVRIDRAEMAPLVDHAATAWRSVQLPDSWDHADSSHPVRVAYRLRAYLDKPADESHAIYIPRAGNRVEVRLNGEILERFGNLEVASADYSKLPLLVVTPARLLRTGDNVIEIRVAAERGHKGGLSRVWFGPEREINSLYGKRMFWLSTGSLLVASACLVLGLLALSVAWRLGDRIYAWFGVATLLWSLRMVNVMIPEPPVPLTWWDPLINAAYGWYIALICLFTLDVLELRASLVRRALGLFAIVTPFVALYSSLQGTPRIWTAWAAVMLLVAATVGVQVIASTVRRPRTEGVLLSLSALLGVGAGARDYLLYRSSAAAYGSFSVTRYVALAFMLAMAWILIDRFARAMRSEAEANRTLTRRVEEKERQLAANYEHLRRLEREHATADERQRIMQDMHDGLGSQLLSSLALVERGALDQRGMAQLLREAIDDMRLAIDTLAPGHEGLLESLGNLRYRLEPRFRAAGTELRFSLRDLPDRIDVPQDAALQILRVLQEALTNALKHARPKLVEVDVVLQPDPPRLLLVVSDDGAGFDPRAPGRGRGLSGMQRRAKGIGASLDVSSGAAGTRVTLSYPMPSLA